MNPRAPIRRARRGTGGAKRGRFGGRSDGGHLRCVVFAPRWVVCCRPVGCFASTVLLPFMTDRAAVFSVCVCSGQKGEACVTPDTAPPFRPQMENTFPFLDRRKIKNYYTAVNNVLNHALSEKMQISTLLQAAFKMNFL